MKKACFVMLLLLQRLVVAQEFVPNNQIDVHYVWSNSGANIAVTGKFQHKKICPFIGLTYHVNMPVNDLRYHKYRHRFYNKNFVDGLGVTFGIVRPLKINNSNVGAYVLYSGQVNRMHNRYLVAYCDTHSVNYQVTRSPDYIYVFSPSQMWIAENSFGIGIHVKMYKDLYLDASAAAGIATYMVNNQYTNHEFFMDWEFCDQYRIGISYVIPRRKTDNEIKSR